MGVPSAPSVGVPSALERELAIAEAELAALPTGRSKVRTAAADKVKEIKWKIAGSRPGGPTDEQKFQSAVSASRNNPERNKYTIAAEIEKVKAEYETVSAESNSRSKSKKLSELRAKWTELAKDQEAAAYAQDNPEFSATGTPNIGYLVGETPDAPAPEVAQAPVPKTGSGVRKGGVATADSSPVQQIITSDPSKANQTFTTAVYKSNPQAVSFDLQISNEVARQLEYDFETAKMTGNAEAANDIRARYMALQAGMFAMKGAEALNTLSETGDPRYLSAFLTAYKGRAYDLQPQVSDDGRPNGLYDVAIDNNVTMRSMSMDDIREQFQTQFDTDFRTKSEAIAAATAEKVWEMTLEQSKAVAAYMQAMGVAKQQGANSANVASINGQYSLLRDQMNAKIENGGRYVAQKTTTPDGEQLYEDTYTGNTVRMTSRMDKIGGKKSPVYYFEVVEDPS
jgi:hypothetical protein